MKIKRTLVLILAIALLASLTACNSNSEAKPSSVIENDTGLAEEQTIHFSVDNDPTILDPQVALDGNALVITGWTFDSLVRKNTKGQYEPHLAESWILSDDETVYTFTIRDANWSDGTKITANDVFKSWVRVLTPETAAQNSYLLFSIKNAERFAKGEVTVEELGVKAKDEKTLEVTLEKPTPYFLELATRGVYSAMKAEFMEEHGDKIGTTPELTIASGPFIIKEWNHEQEVILERNPEYWDKDNIILDRIEFVVVGDANVLVNMYEANELETVAINAEYYEKYEGSSELYTKPANNLGYIVFNNNDKMLNNESIRKALSYCFDRDTYYTIVDKTGLKPMRGFVPYEFPGKSDGKQFRDYNGDCFKDISGENSEIIKLAQDLFEKGLAEVGATKKKFEDHFSLVLFTPEQQKVAQFIQQNWKTHLGIEIRIEQLPMKVVLDKMFSGDYTGIAMGYGSFYSDAKAYLEMHTSFYGMQTSFFKDETFDNEMLAADSTTGDERIDHLIAAEKAMFDKMPLMPLSNTVTNVAIKSYVKGFKDIPMAGFDYRKAYIEKH